MFPFRVCLLLTISTFILKCVCVAPGCRRQKLADDYSIEHYSKLIKIDTGYSVEIKPQVSEEEANENPAKLRHAIDELHHQLLCSYTFDMLHYMNLLEHLFSENGEQELARLVESNDHTVVYLNQNCISTLNVLYNFGKIDLMGPIWLIYMFVSYLISIDKNDILNRRHSIVNEHQTVFQRLIDMQNKQDCQTQNRYNDQYNESKNFKRLEALRLNFFKQHSIVELIRSLEESMYNRRLTVNCLFDIDTTCEFYFHSEHLRLGTVWRREEFVMTLFVDFAELTDWKSTYARIKNIYEKIHYYSVRELIENVVKFQSLFTSLVKYIMLLNVWKHLTLINLSLPLSDNEEQPHKLWTPWVNHDKTIKRIGELNNLLAKYVEVYIDYFKLKNDLGLVFLTYFVKMPANLITNVQFNKTLKECLSQYMDEIYFEVFGYEGKLVRSSGHVSEQYIIVRHVILKEISEKYNINLQPFIKKKMKYHNIQFESVLSTHLFYELMKSILCGVYMELEFDVLRSFIDFADEFLSKTSY